jgi:hypothetical protein
MGNGRPDTGVSFATQTEPRTQALTVLNDIVSNVVSTDGPVVSCTEDAMLVRQSCLWVSCTIQLGMMIQARMQAFFLKCVVVVLHPQRTLRHSFPF